MPSKIMGTITLPEGVDPKDVEVTVHGKNGAVLTAAAVDKDGAFAIDLDHDAHSHKALAAKHPRISRWFGLKAAEEELATAAGDALKSAEAKVDELRNHVADFVAAAPHLAAHAEGRDPKTAHDVVVKVASPKGSVEYPATLKAGGAQLGALGATKADTDPNIWKYDPDDALPRRLWGVQTLDKPTFDDKWQATYLKMLVYTSAPGRTRPYGSYVANFLEKSELKPYWSYQLDLLTSPVAATKFKDLDDVQSGFVENLSIKKKGGDMFVSDAYLVSRLLQGIYSPYFLTAVSGEVETLTARFLWGAYDKDGPYVLNDIDVELTRKSGSEDTPTLASITVAGTKYVPRGDAKAWSSWNWAKMQLMISALLAGETDQHLARGHLVVEQYLLPCMMHLSEDNPARQAIAPHVRDVWGINNFGNPLIFGPTGVLAKCSALSHKGVHQRLQDQLGGLDWKGFHPRKPLCADHHFAVAGNLVWTAASVYVAGWLASNWDSASDDDKARWTKELTAFSSDLVEHAVDHVPTAPGDGYRDTQEFSSPSGGKAVSALDASSRDELEQLLTYVVYHATFIHDWANDRQQDDGGDLLFANFGLRDKAPASGDWDAWWKAAQPEIPAGVFQLFLAQALTNIKWGYIVGAADMQTAESRDHEDHDESKQIAALVKELDKVKDKLAAAGLAITDLRARINT